MQHHVSDSHCPVAPLGITCCGSPNVYPQRIPPTRTIANHWRLLISCGKMQLDSMYRLNQSTICNGSVVRGALVRPVRAHQSTHPTVPYLGHLTALFAGCLRRNRRSSLIVRAGTNGSSPPPWSPPDARLVLEDGSVWHGTSFGTKGTQLAEVVFNTSMTGYQEILTDPSYKGQFVVFTHPHIGNVGINPGVSKSFEFEGLFHLLLEVRVQLRLEVCMPCGAKTWLCVCSVADRFHFQPFVLILSLSQSTLFGVL